MGTNDLNVQKELYTIPAEEEGSYLAKWSVI